MRRVMAIAVVTSVLYALQNQSMVRKKGMHEREMSTRKELRIASWSGPRNISTAMMRSWGNREDTHVSDEPFYAHYLSVCQVDHPGVDEVVASGETNWRKVVSALTGPIPNQKTVWYQKHMTHHLLPHIELDWLESLTHCFLIRQPREMLSSLLAVMPNPGLKDTGLPQQISLFNRVRASSGRVPPVVDARDLLLNPRGVLSQLCTALGLEFSDSMLSWKPGRRETDGVWAKYWYASVEKSSGFEPYEERDRSVPEDHRPLLAECEEIYEAMYRHRLTA